jgi:type II secretory pathway component GspD/PulD (secretin)/tetratricopeptide (TPR) repeat protein
MVSLATKRIWKSVALGLVLSPVIGAAGVASAQTTNPAGPTTKDSSAAPVAPAANDLDTCRKLIREARAALQAGDKAKAEKLARQAAAMKVSFPFWESDTPDKLLLEIGVKTTPPPKSMAKSDPHLLMKQGQDAFKAGKLDDAQRLAQQAKLVPNVKWGMFEEAPEKLLDEVQKARAVQSKSESARLLTEGRKLFDQGKLDQAEKLAYKASSMHGPYGMWDFGDKPEKLIADIQTARDKARKTKVPLVPGTPEKTVAKKSTEKPSAEKPTAEKTTTEKATAEKTVTKAATPTAVAKQDSAVKQASAPPPLWPSEIKTADVKGPDTGPGVTNAAVMPAPPAPAPVVQAAAPTPPMPVVVQGGGPTPPGPLPAPVAALPPMPTPSPAPMPAPPPLNPAKMQAMQCMREGKDHQAAGRYLEARAKFQEAQKCGVDFGMADESPERCLMDLSAAVAKQIDAALKETGAAAEAKLNQARTLAAGFALDTKAIDSRLAAQKPAATQTWRDPVEEAKNVGQTILDKARLELKRGECETARQLATEVHNGNYGLQAEAVVLLRTIDVEEHNQRVLTANRNFDAGLAAFRGKEYAQAMAILQQVDSSLLAVDRKLNLKQIMDDCARLAAAAQAPSTAAVQAPPPPAAGIGPVAGPATRPTAVTNSAAAAAQVPPPPLAGGVVPVAGPGTQPTAVTNAAAKAPTGLQGPMPKMTAPTEGDSLAAQVQAMQEIEYQALRDEGLKVQSRALQMWERGETDAALEALDAYMKKVKASKLDPASVARLQKPIDAKVKSFGLMKAQKDSTTRVTSAKDKFVQERSAESVREQKKREQVKELMKQYDTNYKQCKYEEAKLCALKAKELDPDDSIITAAVQIAEQHEGLSDYDTIRKQREALVLKHLNDTGNEGPPVDMKNPMAFDRVQMQYANKRTSDRNGVNVMRTSAKDREIQSKLNKPIQVNFQNVPLQQAINDLRTMTKMNMHLETQALAAEAINPDAPVTLIADNISLRSALKVLLDQVHLTCVPADEMLKITTPRGAQGKLEQRVFSVADLVIPIDDYILPDSQNYPHMIQHIIDQQKINLNGMGGTPMPARANMLPNGQPVGTGSGANSMSTAPGGEASLKTTGVQPGSMGSSMSHIASVAPTKQNMQDMLIKLITNTVAPSTWAEAGGSGTIDYMPIGMALVVNQTPDVQEQVADLLDALRRLQDLEVAVEVRIITLAETFFERIGLDFSLNITPDKHTQSYEPQITTGQFAPPGFINAFMPRNFLSGARPGGLIGPSNGNTGSLTSDLDIPIRSSSFQYAIPPFAYPNNPGFDGGLSLGLAFLSDIQVYMFMEAAQGDRRTNVMSAPKLTLFNGQTSTINVNDQQFFVTNVNVVGFGGQIVFVPVNNPVPLGISLAIQAVVSADRRFVRLNLAPSLSNLASAIVPLFPVTTFITPVFEGGAQGQPIPFTQFIQQPNVATVQIQTTVSIPDGGTVVLGGLKTLSEGRNEFGPPVLSKIPYIDRIFKNVGYGREAQSLLLMVTPRIIINSEEEERQTGEISAPTVRP